MLYDTPTWAIVIGLLLVSLAANELGFRYGRRRQGRESELSKTVSNTLKAAFSRWSRCCWPSPSPPPPTVTTCASAGAGPGQRHRHRLPARGAAGRVGPRRNPRASAPLPRCAAGAFSRRLPHASRAGDAKGKRVLMNGLWAQVELQNAADPAAIRTSLIVPAINEVIDLSSSRVWANRNHLPSRCWCCCCAA